MSIVCVESTVDIAVRDTTNLKKSVQNERSFRLHLSRDWYGCFHEWINEWMLIKKWSPDNNNNYEKNGNSSERNKQHQIMNTIKNTVWYP